MIFKGAKLITKDGVTEAEVKVEAGKIAKIAKDVPAVGDEVEDLSGLYLTYGAIDGHTHFNSRFLGAKEPIPTADDYKTGSEVALAGGITSFINFFESSGNPVLFLSEEVANASVNSMADFSFHFIVKREEEIKRIRDVFAMGTKSVKVFMAYDNMRLSDLNILRVMEEVKALGGVVAVHAENGDVIDYLQQKYESEDPIYHAKTRPTESEVEAVNRFATLAYLTKVKSYVVHVSSPRSLDVINEWRKRGAEIYAETCPHYLTFNETAYLRKDGKRFIMSPPLRSEEERKDIVKRLKEFYTVGSDYSGYLSKYKDESKSYKDVPNGVASTEFLVPVLASLMAEGYIDPQAFHALTSGNAVKLYNLKEKGLEEGKDADFVAIKLEEWVVKEWHGRMDHSIYDGVKFKAKVARTYLRGELVYEEGDVKGGRGKLLER
ncbi:MAG: amidohydrolase family protein [Candidatus Aramenus sp.]|nr:amidohydrolase family protein [Candidatus Aramenus sp.]